MELSVDDFAKISSRLNNSGLLCLMIPNRNLWTYAYRMWHRLRGVNVNLKSLKEVQSFYRTYFEELLMFKVYPMNTLIVLKKT